MARSFLLALSPFVIGDTLSTSFTLPDQIPATAQIVIEEESLLKVAPEAVNFSVTVTGFDAGAPTDGDIYDERLHDIYYHWDFDDDYTFEAPVNLETAHKNAGISYGPHVSHTFRADGTYTPTCTVYGKVGGVWTTVIASTVNVVVGDPDDQFAGALTYFVDTGGDYTGKPTDAGEYTSIDSALDDIEASTSTIPKRLMARRGQTLSMTGSRAFDEDVPSVHMVAGPGTGAKATINFNQNGDSNFIKFNRANLNSDKEFVMQDIIVAGDRDVTTATGDTANFLSMGANPPDSFLVDRCEISNVRVGVSDSGGIRHKVVNDTLIEHFQSAAVYDHDYLTTALTGCRLKQHEDCLANGAGFGSISAVRAGKGNMLIFDANDAFNSAGNSGLGNYFSQQGGIRFNTGNIVGAVLNCQRSSFEAGGELFKSKPEGNPDLSRVCNVLVEKCILVGSFMTSNIFSVNHTGVTIRNNVGVRPDEGSVNGVLGGTNSGDASSALATVNEGQDGDSDPDDAPIKFYSNTIVNLQSSANYNTSDDPMVILDLPVGFPLVTEANNLLHQPNLDTPIDIGPFDTSQLWTPLFDGYQDVSNPTKDTGLATPDAWPSDGTKYTAATYAPLTTNDAIGGYVSGDVAFDDFYGSIRQTIADSHSRAVSLGHVEVDLAS